jgi:hypothetical protein
MLSLTGLDLKTDDIRARVVEWPENRRSLTFL